MSEQGDAPVATPQAGQASRPMTRRQRRDAERAAEARAAVAALTGQDGGADGTNGAEPAPTTAEVPAIHPPREETSAAEVARSAREAARRVRLAPVTTPRRSQAHTGAATVRPDVEEHEDGVPSVAEAPTAGTQDPQEPGTRPSQAVAPGPAALAPAVPSSEAPEPAPQAQAPTQVAPTPGPTQDRQDQDAAPQDAPEAPGTPETEPAAATAPTSRGRHTQDLPRSYRPRPERARQASTVSRMTAAGRGLILTVLALVTVAVPLSGRILPAATATSAAHVAGAAGAAGSAASTSAQATAQPSGDSVAAPLLGSDADWDDSADAQLNDVADAATKAKIREAYEKAAVTCSATDAGASGESAAFTTRPEVFYPMLPGSYRLSSPFGYRIHPTLGYLKLHEGQDMAASTGTAIYAASAGTVTEAGFVNSTGTITIKTVVDGQTFYTRYLHMYSEGIYVKVGDEVEAGELIAGVGSTGRSTGPHLHFEVRTSDDWNSESAIDPMAWLEAHHAVQLTTDCS